MIMLQLFIVQTQYKYCQQYNSYDDGGSIMKKKIYNNISIIVCANAVLSMSR